MMLTWLCRVNQKKETESLLKADQINSIGTNDMKARIDKTWKNSRYTVWRERERERDTRLGSRL